MRRKRELPVDLHLLPKGELERDFKYFFEYFLDHACCCRDKDCVCRASTFMDLICEPELRKNEKYYRLIQEILTRE